MAIHRIPRFSVQDGGKHVEGRPRQKIRHLHIFLFRHFASGHLRNLGTGVGNRRQV